MPIVPVSHRRDFLRFGTRLGISLAIPSVSAAQRGNAGQQESSPKSVILVLLAGGLSHVDTLDMKPDAPAEVRGEFKSIATSVPGIQVCEHLPLLAARMQHWALVRSFSHGENNHLPGVHRLLTGATMPNQRSTDLDNVLSRRDWPCYAAGLNYLRPRHDGIPNGVTLPHALIEGSLTWPGQHAGFLGPAHDPMLVRQDPNSPSFQMEAFTLANGVDAARLENRRRLLERISDVSPGSDPFRGHQEKAFELLTSRSVRVAFELEREPQRLRDRYGRHQFGQSLLLARRLTEAGVPMIQANMGIVQSWDTHVDNWGRLKNKLLPPLDLALAALVDDLQARGTFDETLIVVMGEFGRTPRVSTLPGEKIPGRDHWASVYSGLFAGGGVRGGRVIGKSDKAGAYPVTTPFTPFDVGATVYQALGIDTEQIIRDALNRPSHINAGKPMDVLYRNA